MGRQECHKCVVLASDLSNRGPIPLLNNSHLAETMFSHCTLPLKYHALKCFLVSFSRLVNKGILIQAFFLKRICQMTNVTILKFSNFHDKKLFFSLNLRKF